MWDWFADNGKTIVAVAASVLVGIAVTALVVALAPVAAPALLVTTVALALGGFASGVTYYAVSHWLEDEPMSWKEALWEGTVSMLVSLATFGLGRAFAPALSRVVSPAAAEVVSFSTAGATTGAANQIASNALNDRPLLENVPSAATKSAIFAGTATAVAPALPRVLSPEEPLAVEPAPVDPVTQTQLDKYGLTRESYVYRVMEEQYVKDGKVAGNPRSSALVADPYNAVDHPYQPYVDTPLPKLSPEVPASTLGPSLNVAVKDPSIYAKPGMVKVAIKVGDLLDRGGRIYPDRGALVQGIDPILVTFDGEVPVTIVKPGTTITSDTTAGETPGIVGRVEQASR